MSMTPNNPFEGPQDAESPPKKKGKGCLWGCLIGGVGGIFVCCGGALVLTYIGMGAMGDEFERRLADNPAVTENVGEIQSFDFTFTGTIEEAQKVEQQGGGETAIVFDVEGSKGSGRILVVQDPSGANDGIKSATLVMSDGTRHELELGDEGGFGAEGLEGLDLDEMIDTGDVDLPDMNVPEPAPN